VKRAARILVVAVAAFAAAVLIGGCMGLFSGTRPDNLGVKDGRLAPCKPTPNCVSSFADKASDRGHHIEPFRFEGNANAAFAKLTDLVRASGRATIVREEPGYLYVEFKSKVMGFVDDVEFLLDPAARTIHVRSASRLGRRDFGVNRERIESLRADFAATHP
jgi:uncharacterized protein (DUF1499 family)